MSSVTPRPGIGTRLAMRAGEFVYSAAATGARWPHSWKPSLGPNGLTLSRGVVQGIYEPKIGDKPISSGVQLALNAGVANADGKSWAALEFPVHEDGSIDDKTDFQVVHTAQGLSGDPLLARLHLVLILWRDQRPFLTHEIVMFDPVYRRITKPGERPAFHWFG